MDTLSPFRVKTHTHIELKADAAAIVTATMTATMTALVTALVTAPPLKQRLAPGLPDLWAEVTACDKGRAVASLVGGRVPVCKDPQNLVPTTLLYGGGAWGGFG